MIFSTLYVVIFFLIALMLPVWSQELSYKSWPKNIRQNFEEREKPEDIHFDRFFDREMRLLLLHPDEAKREREKRLKMMRTESRDEEGLKSDEKNTKDKKEKADKLLGVLKASDMFTYSPVFQQMTSAELLASSGVLTFLLENDRVIYREMDQAMQTPFWKNNGSTINLLGDGSTAVGIYSLLAICGGEKNLKAAQIGLESFAYTGLQVIGLKNVVGKSRPSAEYEERWTLNSCDAFPSGHTSTAFSLATVLDRMYNIGWFTYPLAGLNGIARIQANTHWMSDVFLGALMGHFGANEIMARHGIIDRKKIERRDSWENTLYQVDSFLENSSDSCANFNEQDPQQDDVGIMALNYSISHCISPYLILQLSSRFHKKTFNTLTWNNVEDKQINFRVAHRINPGGIFYVEKSIQNINYIDIQYTYFNRGRGHYLPDPENYLEHNQLDCGRCGFLWEFSPNLDAKLSYDTYTDYYDAFEFLNGYGGLWGLDVGGTFGGKKDLTLMLGYQTGQYSAAFPQYSYALDRLRVILSKDFSDTCSLNLLYEQGGRGYRGCAYVPQGTANDRWFLSGVELNSDFQKDWSASLNYYRKSLTSTNPQWTYRKNVYSINITNRF